MMMQLVTLCVKSGTELNGKIINRTKLNIDKTKNCVILKARKQNKIK